MEKLADPQSRTIKKPTIEQSLCGEAPNVTNFEEFKAAFEAEVSATANLAGARAAMPSETRARMV